MSPFKQIITTLWLLLACSSLLSQNLNGIVLDSATKEPLPFVNILFNGNSASGTTTDIEGRFKYPSSVNQLELRYVGYKTRMVNVNPSNKQLTIYLASSDQLLKAVEILPGENPAHRIIINAVENRKRNAPEYIEKYQYTSYNKVFYDLFTDSTKKADSGRVLLRDILKGGHMLMMESITEKKYRAPDFSEEVIIANKISGLKEASFAPLASDMQPFSFYDNEIQMLELKYLNPISSGSINYYHFQLQDTIYHEKDTTFIISFQPKPKKNFNGMRGSLYIHTSTFAIQNVIAQPAKDGLMNLKIRQEYQYLNNEQWFPSQLDFELSMPNYPTPEYGMMVKGQSYIRSVDLSPTFDKKITSSTIEMAEDASQKDSVFWTEQRTLNRKEEITYEVLDSLNQELHFDRKLKAFEKLATGKIPVKFLDILIPYSLIANDFEGWRVGMAVSTNEKLSKKLTLSGNWGYGLKDKRIKYGGELDWVIHQKKDIGINLKYQNGIAEFGSLSDPEIASSLLTSRIYLSSRANEQEMYKGTITSRLFRHQLVSFSLLKSQEHPLYDYHYSLVPGNYDNLINRYEAGVNVKFIYKEKFAYTLGKKISLGSKYPEFNISYNRGLIGLKHQAYNYNRINTSMIYSFSLAKLGLSKIRINTGWIDATLPATLLYSGEGNYQKNQYFTAEGFFETMAPYEFLSDQFAHLFFSHNFGSLLFKTDKFSPTFKVVQNLGIGQLSYSELHQNISFKTMEKGYFESGIEIGNLLRLNYLNVAYLTFGVGAYYRYGAYHLPEISDNLAFKLVIGLSTR